MRILYVIRDMSFIEPLGIMFLSAIGKRDGHTSSLAIINEEDVLAKIAGQPACRRDRPDLVCMSIMSVEAEVFKKLATDIKESYPDIFIVAGGPHVTFEVDDVRQWPVDAAVQGEGDWAYRDLLRAVDAGEPFDDIPNVHTKNAANPMRRLIEPLDDLPHPDRELVYFPGGHLAGLNVKSFMTSRGCAYRCTYCFNSKLNEMYSGNGKPVRRFSVDYTIEEIERVVTDYGATFIRLGDDVFAYRIDDWLLEFSKAYRQRVGLPFYCLVRPNLLKPDLVKVLRQAGCHSINMSIEAGSERLRRDVLLRSMNDQVIFDAISSVHDAGIHIYANAMLGLPNTTIEDDIETVRFTAKCRVAYPSFSILTPFRGTTIGERCQKLGLIEGGYPENTQDRSMLNCFTEKQKDIQVNLVHLGIVANRFPFLRNLILNRLIYMRPNKVFFFVWYVLKNYVSAKYIFPIQANVFAKMRLAWRALSYELSGRLSLRRMLGMRGKRKAPPRVISDQKPVLNRPGPVFQEEVMVS